MTAFYNEIDPYAAQWLRNLITFGHIAPGIVDERPIQEIEAYELMGFTQCHFFAGQGVWSYALRQAGWSDDRPIWTGSCPCQPFSNAGQKKGFDDDRHLWPYWKSLINERAPSVVIGEQVASALDWVDLVSTDMEGSGYAFGAADLCAAGFEGAHVRQRLYFVAMADTGDQGREGRLHRRQDAQREDIDRHIGRSGTACDDGRTDAPLLGRTPVDWLFCRDGKWRPVEPGTFPLVNETAARVGRLRAYGNALDAQTAIEFCSSVKEICDEIGV